MKKTCKKAVAMLMVLSVIVLSFSIGVSAESDYTIVSPYADVIWEGEDAWGAYKGNLHTHSTASDASIDLNDIILEHYNQNFDFLAMTDHGVTGVEWNEKPYGRLLYSYQKFVGKNVTPLTDEQYEGVLNGTYPVGQSLSEEYRVDENAIGKARGFGMTSVTGGNELNALTISKPHVNGYFLPSDFGNMDLGFENNYEYEIKRVQEVGGLSIINHPGDWLNSRDNEAAVHDPENIQFFADIFLRYDTCMGMEVFNSNNGTEPHTRELWDNILMATLPYGRNVIGFSNSDTHDADKVDSSYAIFMMKENNVENIKKTMQSGASFLVTHKMKPDEELGPKGEYIDAGNTGLPVPMFKKVVTDGHKITVVVENTSNLTFVANGKVIAEENYTTNDAQTYTLDLDTIPGSEEFLYVRAQLIGEGGLTMTQPLIIDDGSEPHKYEPAPKTFWERILDILKCTKIYAVIELIYEAIVYA